MGQTLVGHPMCLYRSTQELVEDTEEVPHQACLIYSIVAK